jgi:RecB family exonuclease
MADESVIAPPPREGFRGGAEVLKAQAACGFRAFAERRLFSAGLETRAPGLTAMERGSLIHRAMEGFWRAVETQAALKGMSGEERAGTLAAAVDEALADYAEGASRGWGEAYLAVERERLMHLLGRWLEFEATRSPFVVRALEETLREVEIGPLRLTVRVDRIDVHLVEGEPAGEILLDYKTGVVRPADWLTERPDEPQLPLYAVLAGGDRLAGVAFASLRAGDGMKMSGYEAAKSVLPRASRPNAGNLEEQVDAWRAVLTELARQFDAGEAQVAPKRYPTTCRYCDQRLLCRLDAAKLEPETLDDLEEAATDWEADFA